MTIEARSGVWWRPDDPGRRVPGTLIRFGDQWQLNVTGRLPEEAASDGLSLVPPQTIHGACLGVRYTLNHCYIASSRHPASHRHPDDEGDEQFSQTWIRYTLIQGSALPADTLYRTIRFQLTQLTHWWRGGGLRNASQASPDEYQPPTPTTVECGYGLTLTFWADITSTFGSRRRSMVEEVYLTARHDQGLSLDELLDDIVLPLRRLVSIVHGARGKYHDVRLYLTDEANDLLRVDPNVEPSAEGELGRRQPLFPGNDEAIRTLFPRWLHMHRANELLPIVVAEPGHESGPVQTVAVELINALETLHRSIHEPPTTSPFAEKVAKAVDSLTDFTKRERSESFEVWQSTTCRWNSGYSSLDGTSASRSPSGSSAGR